MIRGNQQITGQSEFESTAKHQTARRIADRSAEEGRPTLVLHVGDYDPSGVAIIDSLADDIWAFLDDLGYDGVAVADFDRIAVTPSQIEAFDLPGAPAKSTDNRAGFTDLAVQAEALSPPQLERILTDAVAAGWDDEVYADLLETEATERAGLIDALEAMQS